MRNPTLLTGRVPALAARVAKELFAAEAPLDATRKLLDASGLFDAAVFVASPSLHAALAPWRGGAPPKKRRAPLKALAYALRMATRPTPLGLFATVAPLRVGEASHLSLSAWSECRLLVTADVGWLQDVQRRLERHPDARLTLPVVANDLVVERANRLWIRHHDRLRRGLDRSDPIALQYDSLSIKSSEVLRIVTRAAEREIALGELVRDLQGRLDMEPPSVVALVDRLLELGLLVFPRPMGGDASERIAEIGGLTATLHALAKLPVPEINCASVIACVRSAMGENREQLPVRIDLIDRFNGSLGKAVLDDVGRLASFLLAGSGARRLEAYRDRFLSRYEGSSRFVPLLELVDPEIGIGIPPDTSYPQADVDTARDEVRGTLVARAFSQSALEVELAEDEAAVLYPDRLTVPWPAHGFEIGFQVIAEDRAVIDEGRYLIRSIHGTNTDGPYKTVHRFSAAFGDAFVRELRAMDDSSEAVLPAELVFAADRKYANLLQVPRDGAAVASRSEALPAGWPASSRATSLSGSKAIA